MALTAASRARTRLRAETCLDSPLLMDIAKGATVEVKGGGTSLLTSGVINAGAAVHIDREEEHVLGLAIASGRRLIELCRFSARVYAAKDGSCIVLVIGGLEAYKTSQPRVAGLIPSGPKSIPGFDLYKRYLTRVSEAVRTADAGATIHVGVPEAGVA
jgi:hypothetical protein